MIWVLEELIVYPDDSELEDEFPILDDTVFAEGIVKFAEPYMIMLSKPQSEYIKNLVAKTINNLISGAAMF